MLDYKFKRFIFNRSLKLLFNIGSPATMQGFFYQCPYKQGSRTQDNITLNRNFVLSLRR